MCSVAELCTNLLWRRALVPELAEGAGFVPLGEALALVVGDEAMVMPGGDREF